jgi:type I restriction enzyme S subunit
MTNKRNDALIMNTGLPKGWKYAKLGEVCEILDGKRKPINSSERNNRIAGKKKNQLFPYYGATGQVGYIDDYLLDGEYVLLGEDGAPFLEPFKDKAYIVNGKLWVNNHAHILKSYSSNKFLCYYLNQISYREYVTGTTRLKLNQSLMKEIPVVVPPLPEQHRIVAKLEELFSELEKGNDQLRTALDQLKVYRQAVLKYAFEGKLTNKKVKDGELPKGWKWVKLGEVIDEPKYGTSKKCTYDLKGKAVLRIPNIGNGFVDSRDLKYAEFDSKEIETYKLQEGDILTIRSNGSIDLVGKCALITKKDEAYLYAGYLICLRAIKGIVNPKYLINVLVSINLRNQIESKAKSTSGVNNINSGELKSLIIPLCPIEEQHRIVEEIESRLSVADKLEETITASLQQSETLRQSILKKAFEGKLV